MNNAIIQLLILAAVAVFLVFRLKNLLGTREGFEKRHFQRQLLRLHEKYREGSSKYTQEMGSHQSTWIRTF